MGKGKQNIRMSAEGIQERITSIEREITEGREYGIGGVLFPKINKGGLLDTFENHLIDGDRILRAVLDIAELGQDHSSDVDDYEGAERFYSIIEFIRLYRAGNSMLIEELYKAKRKAA
jgi:hypothetical protein